MEAFSWNTVIHEVVLDGWSHATCWHALAARYHFVSCLGCFCATTETWKIFSGFVYLVVYFFEMCPSIWVLSHVFVKQTHWPDFGKTDWRIPFHYKLSLFKLGWNYQLGCPFAWLVSRDPYLVSIPSPWSLSQWSFLVPLIGGRYHIIPQLAVYTTYIPLIYCQLGDYMVPTTY